MSCVWSKTRRACGRQNTSLQSEPLDHFVRWSRSLWGGELCDAFINTKQPTHFGDGKLPTFNELFDCNYATELQSAVCKRSSKGQWLPTIA